MGVSASYEQGQNVICGWLPVPFISQLCSFILKNNSENPLIRSTLSYYCLLSEKKRSVNRLTPNDHYSGRIAALTSKVAFYIFIQQKQVLQILNMAYTLRFFFSKWNLFHNSNVFCFCSIHILYIGCAKIKKNNSGAKRLNIQTFCKWKRHFVSLVKPRPDGTKLLMLGAQSSKNYCVTTIQITYRLWSSLFRCHLIALIICCLQMWHSSLHLTYIWVLL